jgi:hypothetical protein
MVHLVYPSGKISSLGLASTVMSASAGYGSFLHDWSRTVEPGTVVELVPQEAAGVDTRTLTYFQETLKIIDAQIPNKQS